MSNSKAAYNLEWVPDCHGKQDYDGTLVSLSCRMYPRGGGFIQVDTKTGEVEENSDRPDIPPEAEASILLGDPFQGPYETLAYVYFQCETEEEVKAKVEEWSASMIAKVEAAVRQAFAAGNEA